MTIRSQAPDHKPMPNDHESRLDKNEPRLDNHNPRLNEYKWGVLITSILR